MGPDRWHLEPPSRNNHHEAAAGLAGRGAGMDVLTCRGPPAPRCPDPRALDLAGRAAVSLKGTPWASAGAWGLGGGERPAVAELRVPDQFVAARRGFV